MEEILKQLTEKFPIVGIVLIAIGSLCVLATIVVKITKTVKDDEFLAKILDHPIFGKIVGAFMAFSVVQPKQPSEPPKVQ